jgi:hypothetical protein
MVVVHIQNGETEILKDIIKINPPLKGGFFNLSLLYLLL